ncbi:hypothetical protein TWF694_004266 [Orbilia ellipsospora]|uniref:Uncharacterized protein n=1 Tax=Orbilia ellipsospora TaxID=2528407 RepID=A0AAV9WYR0_9PEZI
MSRYLPSTPSTPTILHSTNPIPPTEAHALLQDYLQSKDSSQPWSHSHDAGTTTSLKKIALALRGLHGPAANHHFASDQDTHDGDNIDMADYNAVEDEDGVASKVDTDEGGEVERRRVYETVEGLEAESDEDGLKELQDVKRDEVNPEEEEAEAAIVTVANDEEDGGQGGKGVVDKEERKRLKKLRHKEEKRRKEAERREEVE